MLAYELPKIEFLSLPVRPWRMVANRSHLLGEDFLRFRGMGAPWALYARDWGL